MLAEFAKEVAKGLKQEGISVYVDTCGFVSRNALEQILPYTDKFLFDIKAFNAQTHKKCTGVDNALILENLRFLSKSGACIEVRIPLVKGYNDNEIEDIAKMLSTLNIQKVKVLKYHSLARSRYEALSMLDTKTNVEDVENAVKILLRRKRRLKSTVITVLLLF